MAQNKNDLPNLREGIAVSDIPEGGMIGGLVDEERVLIARHDGTFYAVGATCTHYSGPLDEGVVVDCSVRCPWHHARFDLRSGAVIGAPALQGLPRWEVEVRDDRVYVGERIEEAPALSKPAKAPESVVIVGGGAAGEAAAEMLRNEGYSGKITILSADATPPCDRPNLSKDYLAGQAQEDWIPLRDDAFYRKHEIELRLDTPVASIDTKNKKVKLKDGGSLDYGALLLATGAEPRHLDLPGSDLPHVHYLRSQRDSEAIVAAIEKGVKRAVVIGASFIGLEVAAALRQRDIEVHVVAPDEVPLARVMGPEIGQAIQALHESKGVNFHLQRKLERIDADAVTLDNGQKLECDLVVAGIGVQPRLSLAKEAGLDVDKGVLVNELLQTSADNVYAAGDIASWPDPISGQRIRVEHWVVAQRHGQAVARNMLGATAPYAEAPFFWSKHYDLSIRYVGHATDWDRIEIDGDPKKQDCAARFMKGDKLMALVTMSRDELSLQTEAEMEREATKEAA